MAAIPWGKYDKADWQRVPGAERRYALRGNPSVTISRRQFDQHYGAARAFYTYEKKAKHKAATEREAILRPARGRNSALKLSNAEKEVELNRRRVAQKESQALKRVQKERSKQHRYPTKIDLRSFKKGKIFRVIELPINYEAIEGTRAAAERSKLVFGYYVGINLIDRDGELKSVSQFAMRHISYKYSQKDFEKLLDLAQEKSYAELISCWIHLKLKEDVARNRNGWHGRKLQ